jgi:hypothetical protein
MEDENAPPVRPIGFNGEAPPVTPLSASEPDRLYRGPSKIGSRWNLFSLLSTLFVVAAIAAGVVAAIILTQPKPICGNRHRVRACGEAPFDKCSSHYEQPQYAAYGIICEQGDGGKCARSTTQSCRIEPRCFSACPNVTPNIPNDTGFTPSNDPDPNADHQTWDKTCGALTTQAICEGALGRDRNYDVARCKWSKGSCVAGAACGWPPSVTPPIQSCNLDGGKHRRPQCDDSHTKLRNAKCRSVALGTNCGRIRDCISTSQSEVRKCRTREGLCELYGFEYYGNCGPGIHCLCQSNVGDPDGGFDGAPCRDSDDCCSKKCGDDNKCATK